jgi:hypothetical protein
VGTRALSDVSQGMSEMALKVMNSTASDFCIAMHISFGSPLRTS